MLLVTWFWCLVGVQFRVLSGFVVGGWIWILCLFGLVWVGLICVLLGYGFGVVAVCRIRPGTTGFVSFGLSVCWLDLLKVG